MEDDDVSRYYATLSRGEAVRAVAHAARPALLLAFAACFVAGVWLGRWSVLFETRARRRHLDAAVEKSSPARRSLRGAAGVRFLAVQLKKLPGRNGNFASR